MLIGGQVGMRDSGSKRVKLKDSVDNAHHDQQKYLKSFDGRREVIQPSSFLTAMIRTSAFEFFLNKKSVTWT